MILAGVVTIAALGVASSSDSALPGPDRDRFIADARAGTERYRDQRVAIADGFKRVGVDFPAMGQHWVHLPRIMADSFAAAHPSVLTYIQIGDSAHLAGVAYTAMLEPGEALPSFKAGRPFWHEHNGSVEEESFPVAGHAASDSNHEANRLSILHAWVWLANPRGMFAADNPGLVQARLSLDPSRELRPAARDAAALALIGEDYYLLAIRRVLQPTVAEEDTLAAILTRHRVRIEKDVARLRESAQVTRGDEERLESAWAALWKEIGDAFPERAAQLRSLATSQGGVH